MRSLLLAACIVMALPASATVIYDVEVNYEGGYTYAFAMEFADDVGDKTETDLIGGDFIDERFSQGAPWTFISEVQIFFSLDFSPDTLALSFVDLDVFEDPTGTTRTDSLFDDVVLLQPERGLLIELAAQGVQVSRRQATVPEPATLALMGLGLAGLGFSRRKKA